MGKPHLVVRAGEVGLLLYGCAKRLHRLVELFFLDQNHAFKVKRVVLMRVLFQYLIYVGKRLSLFLLADEYLGEPVLKDIRIRVLLEPGLQGLYRFFSPGLREIEFGEHHVTLSALGLRRDYRLENSFGLLEVLGYDMDARQRGQYLYVARAYLKRPVKLFNGLGRHRPAEVKAGKGHPRLNGVLSNAYGLFIGRYGLIGLSEDDMYGGGGHMGLDLAGVRKGRLIHNGHGLLEILFSGERRRLDDHRVQVDLIFSKHKVSPLNGLVVLAREQQELS